MRKKAKAKAVYVPKVYLTVDSPGATLGMTLKEPKPEYGITAPCPACRGWGGWHLELDAYNEGKHFDCFCGNCNGWGYVSPEDAGHVHKFEEMSIEKSNALRAEKGLAPATFTYGNCCHNHTCTVCGGYRFIDSGD